MIAERYPRLAFRAGLAERARLNEGYVHPPHIRKAVAQQSLWLVLGFAAFIGLIFLGVWALKATETVFIG